ncbi:hypothetical protein O3W44_22765 [Pantoea sp. LMR881]|uniref:hypothetical protein n=1 Tax=Pantoea sp. LMR881 TaxID=3014336 RepID=UPI0022AF7B63|nr:hypothetical protein [Pantoea sp. LMR881]MCZ4061357.1 hypothetical protein [Pantoea sp. LMR881]
MSDLEIVNDGNQNGVGDVATIAPVENLDAAEDMKEEEVAQVPFLRKAMVLSARAGAKHTDSCLIRLSCRVTRWWRWKKTQYASRNAL